MASMMSLGVVSADQTGSVVIQGDSGQDYVVLCKGCNLTVTLPGNPTTGYTWEIAFLDAAVLRQVGESEFKPESKLIGAGGMMTFRFTGIKAGTATLVFVYRRPFEQDTPPLKTRELRVEVSR